VHGERAPVERQPVVLEAEGEGLCETSRPGGQQPRIRAGGERTMRAHRVGPREWLDGPQQDRGADALPVAHDIDAGVDAVAQVGVQPSGRAEHAAVARRRSGVGVRARVRAVAHVGLHLDDPAGQARAVGERADEETAEQLGRHVDGRAREEASGQLSSRSHGRKR
jgi:hypothetical protein